MTLAFAALPISLLIYGLLVLVFWGWGSLCTRLLKIHLPAFELAMCRIWLGWALAICLLQLLNFAMPANWIASLLLTVGGLVAGGMNRQQFPMPTFDRVKLTFLAAVLFTALWLIVQGMRTPAAYDTGLYHLQSIRWYNEYAIVPGLGNLHGRLAFNQSFFAFPAALNLYPFFEHGFALANGFLILLAMIEGWYALFLQRGERSLSRFSAVFMLPFLAGLSIREGPSSPTPDTATYILQLVIWLQLVRLLESHTPVDNKSRIHLIFILATTVLTVKLSSLGFVMGVGLVIFLHDHFSRPSAIAQRVTYLASFCLVPAFFMLVWIVRGYFLSGYPLYPLTVGALSVDWQMPVEFAEGEARAIYLWSRHRSMNPLSDDWLWTWLLGLSRLWAVYPVLVTLFMAVFYGVARWFSPTSAVAPAQKKCEWKPIAAASIPPILGLFFWWLTAPDPRFARSLFALLPLLMAYVLLQRLEQNGWGKPRWNQVGIMLLIYLAVGATFAADVRGLMQMPAGFAETPKSEISIHRLPTGLSLNVPVDDDRCWNAPLPCSPYVLPELQLRGSDLQQGFAIASP